MNRLLATATLLAALATPARAHEFWLSPSGYRPAAGDVVSVSMLAGTGFRGEVKPYAVPRTVRFVLRGARVSDLRGLAANGDPVAARFRVADGSGQLLAYESNFASIELPAPEFDRYLKLEGLDGPLAARKDGGPGRERYARCPKAWIGAGHAERVTQPAGLTLEIVPLADPSTSPRLPVRVLLRGQPLGGVLVRAWNRPLAGAGAGAAPVDPAARDSVGPVAEKRTNARGEAALDVGRAGEWLVSAVHMEPSTDKQAADWQSFWASVTFARDARRENRAP